MPKVQCHQRQRHQFSPHLYPAWFCQNKCSSLAAWPKRCFFGGWTRKIWKPSLDRWYHLLANDAKLATSTTFSSHFFSGAFSGLSFSCEWPWRLGPTCMHGVYFSSGLCPSSAVHSLTTQIYSVFMTWHEYSPLEAQRCFFPAHLKTMQNQSSASHTAEKLTWFT